MISFDDDETPKKPAAKVELPGPAEAEGDGHRERVAAPRLPVLIRPEPMARRPVVSTVLGVTAGLAAIVAVGYAFASAPTYTEVNAYCVNQEDVLADDQLSCDEDYVHSQGGYHSNGVFFLPSTNGSGAVQYHYNYGGEIGPSRKVYGGATSPPPNAEIKRGGFGSTSGGKSSGS